MKIPFVGLDRQYANLRPELHEALDKIGLSGNFILGAHVERFEEQVAEFCGTRFALGVGNGSDALFLIMKALEIGSGDEVITCSNSFIATAWTIVACGAKPVFVDVRDDFNIDPDLIAHKITSKTKAILPIHLTGRPSEMDKINKLAASNDLFVIEDAAQAFGASYRDQRVGSLGIAAAFSLHPLKNLGLLGDGGVITTSDETLYHKIILLRNHGLANRDECHVWGYNSRLDALQATFGSIKMAYIEDWNNRCRTIAKLYRTHLTKKLTVPVDKEWEMPVYHNFIVQTEYRDALMAYLEKKGIGTRIHYPIPIHLQRASKNLGYQLGSLPKTEAQVKKILSLPIYPELDDSEVAYVIETVNEFYD
jgi:dTDP-4-amino-4,6-dideoxygalactose transaminase